MSHGALCAPQEACAMDVARRGVLEATRTFAVRRDFAAVRTGIVTGTPSLRERELIKLAHLADALADVLRGRGVGEPTASLCAEAGLAVFRVAFDQWVAPPGSERDLTEMAGEGFVALGAAATASGG